MPHAVQILHLLIHFGHKKTVYEKFVINFTATGSGELAFFAS
jgi:hypothetical protein